MKVGSARVWLGCFSAAAVLALVIAHVGRKPPGELASVHSREPDLSGSFSCSKCHGGLFESMAESCLDCHTDIGAHIEEESGLHGTLSRDEVMLCALCHSDHHGQNFAMVNLQSFAAAGVPDPDKFDHGRIGFSMEGKHLEVECKACHKHAPDKILPRGTRRYLGLEQDCATCHEDVHEGRYVVGCAQCHGQNAWNKLESKGHEKQLPLIGGHGDVSCDRCHGESNLHSLEAVGAGRELAPRQCTYCHDSPHERDFIEGVAMAARKKPGTTCVDCHEAEHATFNDLALQITPTQHAQSGFSLGVPHNEVACAGCHKTPEWSFASRYPGRSADNCAVCHTDPHGGQFDDPPYDGSCVECHAREHWEPSTFTEKRHQSTALKLTGSHLHINCNDCHKVRVEGTPRVFVRTPNKCGGCHEDAHHGYFDSFMEVRRAPTGTCGLCHLTTTFNEQPKGGFDHGKWTGFPIVGAHAQADCEACHPRSDKPDRRGREFGWVSEHFGPYKDCATCHVDPHEGEFDQAHLPDEVDGETSCARCHEQTSFRAFPDGFEHKRWTGFPLEGAHGLLSCTKCHKPLRAKPTKLGRTWERAKGAECSGCHEDSHGGQFHSAGMIDCARCHRTAATFDDLSFRHDLDSRFRLGEAHDDLACSACHELERIGKVQIVRYRPLGRQCTDCHGEAEDPLRRRKRRKK